MSFLKPDELNPSEPGSTFADSQVMPPLFWATARPGRPLTVLLFTKKQSPEGMKLLGEAISKAVAENDDDYLENLVKARKLAKAANQ